MHTPIAICLRTHQPTTTPLQSKKVKRLARTASASASSGGGGGAVVDPQAAMAKALGELGKEGVDKLLQALETKRGESEDWWVGFMAVSAFFWCMYHHPACSDGFQTLHAANSSICLEELGPDDGIITRCLHVFHRECV